MKKKITLAAVVTIGLSSTFARDYSNMDRLNKKIYDIRDLLDEKRIKISRKDELANDLFKILEKAQKEISNKLAKKAKVRFGKEDRLIAIASRSLNRCERQENWIRKTKCFSDELNSEREILGVVYKSCMMLDGEQNSAFCFRNSLNSIKNGKIEFSQITYKACSSLGFKSDKNFCFSNFLSFREDGNSLIVSRACNALTERVSHLVNKENVLKCYSNGIKSEAFTEINGNIHSIASLINDSCVDLSGEHDTKLCYKRGVQAATEAGYNMKEYVKSCEAIDYDEGIVACYKNTLENLE